MNIGAAIRKIRLERGLTLEQVALEADTYAGNLSKIERGQHPPSLELLHKVAQALGLRMSELYALAENNTATSDFSLQENQGDYTNEVILMRRHFQALTAPNRTLALELIKVLVRNQSPQ